jgi:hypothetical protein
VPLSLVDVYHEWAAPVPLDLGYKEVQGVRIIGSVWHSSTGRREIVGDGVFKRGPRARAWQNAGVTRSFPSTSNWRQRQTAQRSVMIKTLYFRGNVRSIYVHQSGNAMAQGDGATRIHRDRNAFARCVHGRLWLVRGIGFLHLDDGG